MFKHPLAKLSLTNLSFSFFSLLMPAGDGYQSPEIFLVIQSSGTGFWECSYLTLPVLFLDRLFTLD